MTEPGGKLRVAFVVDYFPAVSETFILNQITGLIDRGHSVDIYAQYRWDDAAVHADVERYHLKERTRHFALPRNPAARAAMGLGMLVTNAPRRRALLRTLNVVRYGQKAISLHLLHAAVLFQRSYDIVHCQYGTNGELGAALKELGFQRRLVTTFHGTDIRLAQQRGVRVYRRLLAQGDCFLAISAYNRRQLLAWGFDPAKVVDHPVGIDCRTFTRVSMPSHDVGGDTRIVTVARLVPQKALHNGILAISKVLHDRPNLKLRYDIIGGGPLREELSALVRSLGLEAVIRLHGPLPQDSVIEVLRQSHIFLLPSIDEITPVSLMEAQAIGLPAIATKVGSTDEVVLDGRSGFLVPSGDVEAMAAKLRLLVDQSQLRAAMGEQGSRHIAAHYDVNILNDRLVEIYRRVIGADLPLDIGAARKAEDQSYALRA